jgi:long-subunit acyl-CoA synthetase (AMP-forming)
MTYSVINRVVGSPPDNGGRISFVSLRGTHTLELGDLYERAERLAQWLSGNGLVQGDRIGIQAANCLGWVLLDIAALRLGVVTAGFEPGRFQSDGGMLDRYALKRFFTDRPWDDPRVVAIADVPDIAQKPVVARPLPRVALRPEDVTTLKFTSGSTGAPKGLAATTGSIDSSMRAVQQMFAHGPGDHLFVFLPLSLLQQRYWIYSALCFGHDITVSTYEAAFAALGQAEPTVVMGVPAFFDAARTHIQTLARAAGSGDDALGGAARRVFGDHIRYLWTGSAPAAVATLRFFNEVELPIYEGYGLNETCIVSKNHPGANKVGSVGPVLAEKRVRLDEDGVISVHCDYPVNRRYAYAAPGESERIFGPGGEVRTGDLGHLDEDGFLYVRGRADDLIALANGRKVSLRPIEEHLRESAAIEECVVLSPTRTHLVAVVSPAHDPADEEAIAVQLARTNAEFGPDARIAKVVVAPERFSIANGLLTSQYKPIRARIEEIYRSEIDDKERGIHA